jgi:hypothetical protein
LPKPAETNPVPYALDAEGLKGKSCGERTEIVISTQAFKEEIERIVKDETGGLRTSSTTNVANAD